MYWCRFLLASSGSCNSVLLRNHCLWLKITIAGGRWVIDSRALIIFITFIVVPIMIRNPIRKDWSKRHFEYIQVMFLLFISDNLCEIEIWLFISIFTKVFISLSLSLKIISKRFRLDVDFTNTILFIVKFFFLIVTKSSRSFSTNCYKEQCNIFCKC